MATQLQIVHGSPGWMSPSVVPSKDLVVSPSSSPVVAAVSQNSQGVFVYVRVDNIGTVDLGACACATLLPAVWAPPTAFTGFAATTSASVSQTQGSVKFEATSTADHLLQVPGNALRYSFGAPPGSGRRAWAFSPDGRWFAHVQSPNGNNWFMNIVALQNITRPDGTTIPQWTAPLAHLGGIFNVLWDNSFFGWAGSTAVVGKGPSALNVHAISVACPLAPFPNLYSDLRTVIPGVLDWEFLAGPCGAVVGVVPMRLGSSAPGEFVALVSTRTAQIQQTTSNNLPTSAQIFDAAPTLTTLQHGANGLRVNTGSGTVLLDDPECLQIPGGVRARVDRVKASTLPSGNLGVMAVGDGFVSLLPAGQRRWVQVPNANPAGWANQGEKHWCFLAQAFANPIIPQPWNGQAVNPPPFPNWLINCAQRNIDIA